MGGLNAHEWGANEDQRLKAGYASGQSAAEIAIDVGRTRNAVYQRGRRLGVVTRALGQERERPRTLAERGGVREVELAQQSLRALREARAAAEGERNARIAAARAANERRSAAAHQARLAQEWQPGLTAEQLRDAMARARKLRALLRS